MLKIDVYGDDEFEIKVMSVLLEYVITPFFSSEGYKKCLEQRNKKPWIKRSEVSKRPSRKIPPKKKRNSETLKRRIKNVTKSVITAKK